jgi:hypothetical protein
MPPLDDDEPIRRKPAMDEVESTLPPMPATATVSPPPRPPRSVGSSSFGGSSSFSGSSYGGSSYGAQQANNYNPEIDKQITDHALKIQEEHWLKSYWRPAMGWLYMLICFMDFVVFPALTMFLPALLKGFGATVQYTAWQSLSLSNGGLIHIAFGAILGVAAWSRGQEKINSRN